MSGYRIQPLALAQLDSIHDYTVAQWGEDQAERYAAGAFALFAAIARGERYWHRVKVPRGIDGYCHRYERHIVYWRGAPGKVEIVAILHERMHQSDRVRRAFDESP